MIGLEKINVAADYHFATSSSNALASLKSSVTKPSVNQLYSFNQRRAFSPELETSTPAEGPIRGNDPP
jgi:hypothetical protein